MYIHRYIEDTIREVSRTFKVLYLGGPRQVGKTTTLLHVSRQRKMNYVTLDDLSIRELAQRDPELFLEQYSPPLIIDEVQYAPQLFPAIKLKVDETKRQGLYWLTGSQQFSVLKGVQESLAGRVGILSLVGLSSAEIDMLARQKQPFSPDRKQVPHTSKKKGDIFARILRGSYPRLWERRPPLREIFYNSYIQTYIDRDLRDLFGVTNISAFHRFLQICAARTGQILNYSDMARDTGISVHAAREWLSILESTLQVYLIKPFSKNISKRLIKAPRLYFLDTGLAAYLTKWTTADTLEHGPMAGAFFETFVVSEIIKSYLFRGMEPPIWYFRDKEGHEVDVLLESENRIFPIEIKLSRRISDVDLRGIQYLRHILPDAHTAAFINNTKIPTVYDRDTVVLPVSAIS